MARKMDTSLSEGICSAFIGTAILCQLFFWFELLFHQRIGDGALKFMFYSAGLVAMTFGVLIIHNIIKFAFYLSDREQQRRAQFNA